MKTFRKISLLSGKNSTTFKEQELQALLINTKSNEAKFLVRFVNNNFKINCGEKFIIAGMARAFFNFYSDSSDAEVRKHHSP